MADIFEIAGRINSTSREKVVTTADQILADEQGGMKQSDVNAQHATDIANRYTKEETYSKSELNQMITTPDVEYVSVVATNATTAVTDVLPATGQANTIYRVGNWNGTQYDPTMYTLYAWNGSAYVCLAARSFVGEVYDVSVNHPDGQGNPTPYANLTAALGTDGANIPADIRRGGMSIKFVLSSDNNSVYVQYRLMANEFSTNNNDWQGVDSVPIDGSRNLVESGGVDKVLSLTSQYLTVTGKGSTYVYGSVVRGFRAGCTYKFYIENYNELKDKITEGGYGSMAVFGIEANSKENWSGVSASLLSLPVGRIRDTHIVCMPQTVENTDIEEWYVRLKVRTEDGYKVLVRAEDQTSVIANRDYNVFTGNTGFLDNELRSEYIEIPTFKGSYYEISHDSANSVSFSTRDYSKSVRGTSSIGVPSGKPVIFLQTENCDFVYANVANVNFQVKKLSIQDSNIIDGSSLLYEQGFYSVNNAKSYSATSIRTKYLITVSADRAILKMPDEFVVQRYITCNDDGSYVSISDTLKTNIVLLGTGYYLINVKKKTEGDVTPADINCDSGSKITNYLANKAVDFIEDEVSGTIDYAETLFPYRTYNGHYYIVTNKGTVAFNFSTKDSNGVSGQTVSGVQAGASKILLQTKDCDYIKTNINNSSFKIEEIKFKGASIIDGYTLLYEQGFYNVTGNPTDSDVYIRTKELFNIAADYALITVPDGYVIARIFDFGDNKKMISTGANTTNYVLLNKGYHHINIKKEDGSAINPTEVMLYGDIVQDIKFLHPITAAFDFNTELLDVANELSGMDFDAKDSLECWTFQEQIYDKWDALMAANPTLIEKIDLGAYAEKEYPEYANLNGVASGDYAATPSYRTYMYKLCMPTSRVNVMDAVRRKVFIVAGLHGWENASQFNTYVVGSMLCKIASNDYYALGSVYDFYFIPCLNGYGAYHYTRQNANGVDINRNFPHPNWAKSGVPGDYGYTGESAASEFETKILCKAVEKIKPDFFIDHHTYGPTSYNFYATCSNPLDWPIFYQNLYAWNYRACKEYPEYYGTKYPVRPNGFSNINYSAQTANIWAHNVGVVSSQTLEVCTGIGFINGEPNPYPTSTLYKAPIIRLNELMLRLMLLRFAEYQLKNGLRTFSLDSTLLVE